MLYPLKSLSWKVEVKPSKPRYPSIRPRPYTLLSHRLAETWVRVGCKGRV